MGIGLVHENEAGCAKMALSETCGACGCDLTGASGGADGAIRHGNTVYCAECARLILSPEELVPAKPAGAARPQVPAKPKVSSAAVASLDDDWFAPKESKPGEATVEMPEPPRPKKDKLSGVRGSARPQIAELPPVPTISEKAPEAEIENEDEAEAEIPESPVRKPLGVKPPAGKLPVPGAKKLLSGKRPGKPGKDDREKSTLGAKTRSVSGRSAAIPERADKASRTSGRSSARKSGRASARSREKDEETDRDSLRKGKAKTKSSDNSQMMIYGGVGALLFILLIGFAFMGGGGDKTDAKKGSTTQIEETDKMSSSEYADLARRRQDEGNTVEAARLYVNAANAAEREGKPTQAQKYSTLAYDLKKNSHLDLGHGR